MLTPSRFRFYLALVGACLLLGNGCNFVFSEIQLSRNVTGYLKLAADSNQIEDAKGNLEKALDGMDRMGIVCDEGELCTTRILWHEPQNDVGFWRHNIEATFEDLSQVPADASHLEVSNTLMKVRETLLDDHTVTEPPFVARYAGIGNRGYALIWLLGFLLLIPFIWVDLILDGD